MTNRQRKKFEPIRDLLRCPCCGGDMRIETGSLRCAAGHCFDIASKGYVNLTLAQKSLKGSKTAGRLWNRDSIATCWTES